MFDQWLASVGRVHFAKLGGHVFFAVEQVDHGHPPVLVGMLETPLVDGPPIRQLPERRAPLRPPAAFLQSPAVRTQRILQSLGDRILDLLKKDQVLTAKILRLVNSSYYAIPGGISDVQRALAFLGYLGSR